MDLRKLCDRRRQRHCCRQTAGAADHGRRLRCRERLCHRLPTLRPGVRSGHENDVTSSITVLRPSQWYISVISNPSMAFSCCCCCCCFLQSCKGLSQAYQWGYISHGLQLALGHDGNGNAPSAVCRPTCLHVPRTRYRYVRTRFGWLSS
eukprot:SAG31_NODE_2294_length_5991_cov_2.589613_10_plen_149_part_00